MRQVGMAFGFFCALTSILTPAYGAAPPRIDLDLSVPIPIYWKPTPPTHPADKEARKHLPKEAKDWQFLGAFPLTNGGWRQSLLILYYEDSDYNSSGTLVYPNFFTIHAVYCDDNGKCVRKKVITGCRCGLVRVKAHSPTSVELELRIKCDLRPFSQESTEQFEERAARVRTPFVASVVLDFDGKPVALLKPDTMASGPKAATGRR